MHLVRPAGDHHPRSAVGPRVLQLELRRFARTHRSRPVPGL